jgi:hypothetical protein
MIGNNFNYYNFLLNNNNFISPSKNIGINDTFNKKSENSTKTNIDISSYYLSPQIPTFTPTPNPEQKINTEPQPQPLPTPGNLD